MDRTEVGVAKGTIAHMRRAGSKKRPQEVWIMFEPLKPGLVRMISAWRYPGVSKVRAPIPIPQDIEEEVKKMYRV